MKLITLLRALFQENTGLRLQNNDIKFELVGFLKYPKLYDCVTEEFDRECLKRLDDFHNEEKDLEINFKSKNISFKVNGSEIESYIPKNNNFSDIYEIGMLLMIF